jgi:hypothetical protein
MNNSSNQSKTPNNVNSKKISALFIKIAVSVCLLAYLLHVTDISAFIDRISALPLSFVLLGWVYYAICQLISAYRWQLFLNVKNIHVKVSKLFSFYMVGMFLNNFLPGAVGGDVVKTYDLYKYTNKGNYSVVSVFLERFTGLIGLALIAVVAAIIGFQKLSTPVILLSVWGTAFLLTFIVLMIWYEPLYQLSKRLIFVLLPSALHSKFDSLHMALYSYKNHMGTIWYAVAISTVLQLLFALYYAIAAYALGINVDLVYFIIFLPIITIVTMIPISLGGLGIREGMMVLLFHHVGVSSSDILSISLTVYSVNAVLSLWGGGILLTRMRLKR